MIGLEHLLWVVEKLRSPEGCPWDRAQTIQTMMPDLILEGAEAIAAGHILEKTGESENLKEELGDLLFLICMESQMASEQGLFTLDEAAEAAASKMIRRHPHVFSNAEFESEDALNTAWETIKKEEKAGRTWEEEYLPEAFMEAKAVLKKKAEKKGFSI